MAANTEDSMDTEEETTRLDVAQKRRLEDLDLPPTSGSEGEPDGEEWTEAKARKRANLKKKKVASIEELPTNGGQPTAVKSPKAGAQSKARDEAANDGRHANSPKAGTSRSAPKIYIYDVDFVKTVAIFRLKVFMETVTEYVLNTLQAQIRYGKF
ncbi:hypothetical protein QE152_g39655 [Popillia japonica]|uniref:Uncharacterized protein n=1 Tax=Popillia japonica TaxID=7064 RepID=A0AAW1HTJ1_POPJA